MLSTLRLPLRDEKSFIVSPFARTIEIDVPRPCENHFWILGFGDIIKSEKGINKIT
jgi:hypothetical protein